ncbi:hypothetical protein HDU88_008307 [Geranomyces variabilis]|nr:hypothetical protein HDU88_008307 [Geranomyces variabilis]
MAHSGKFNLTIPPLGRLGTLTKWPSGAPLVADLIIILDNNGTVAINEACDMVDESTLVNPWIYSKPPVYLRHVDLVRYLWRSVNDVLPVRNADNTSEPSDRLFPHMLMRFPIQVLEEPAAYDGVSLVEQRAKYTTDMIICRKARDHDDCVRSNKNLVNSFCESTNQPFHRMLQVKEPDLPDGTPGPVDSYYLPALLFPDYLHVPADFLPLDAELGVPLEAPANSSFELSATVSISRTKPHLRNLQLTKNGYERGWSDFFYFPPQSSSTPYHPAEEQRKVQQYDYLTYAYGIPEALAARPWILNLAKGATKWRFWFGGLDMIYWLIQSTTIGISRAGIETTAAWELGMLVWRDGRTDMTIVQEDAASTTFPAYNLATLDTRSVAAHEPNRALDGRAARFS